MDNTSTTTTIYFEPKRKLEYLTKADIIERLNDVSDGVKNLFKLTAEVYSSSTGKLVSNDTVITKQMLKEYKKSILTTLDRVTKSVKKLNEPRKNSKVTSFKKLICFDESLVNFFNEVNLGPAYELVDEGDKKKFVKTADDIKTLLPTFFEYGISNPTYIIGLFTLYLRNNPQLVCKNGQFFTANDTFNRYFKDYYVNIEYHAKDKDKAKEYIDEDGKLKPNIIHRTMLNTLIYQLRIKTEKEDKEIIKFKDSVDKEYEIINSTTNYYNSLKRKSKNI
jgi:hypothetical protein